MESGAATAPPNAASEQDTRSPKATQTPRFAGTPFEYWHTSPPVPLSSNQTEPFSNPASLMSVGLEVVLGQFFDPVLQLRWNLHQIVSRENALFHQESVLHL